MSTGHSTFHGRHWGCLLAVGIALTVVPAEAGDTEVPPEPPFETLTETMQARGQYIFRFHPDVPASRVPGRAAALTRAVGGELRHTYTTALHGFSARMPSTAMLRLLETADDIISVERDSVDHVLNHCHKDPNHCGGDDGGDDGGGGGGSGTTVEVGCGGLSKETIPWGVDRVDAERVWGWNAAENKPLDNAADATCGLGVHVYVIDTGIDFGHADLQPVDTTNSVDCTKSPCAQGGGAGKDDHGHGTHVAGSAAARANDAGILGVAPGATLHAVKVLKRNGMGFRSDILAGIDWVTAQAKTLQVPVVANMSLGGSGSKSYTCDATTTKSDTDSWGDAYHAAICNAAHAGVVFVVAAGNSGADAAGAVPAAYADAVITVSAIKNMSGDNEQWPDWSNWGNDGADWTSIASAPVGIAAPGLDIVSTRMGGGTTKMSGTSMASPHVAGAVALYLQQHDLTASYSAFATARAAVVAAAEGTSGFTEEKNTTRHDEGFLDAETLVATQPIL